jgi:uracil-DNA glycosylase family 4
MEDPLSQPAMPVLSLTSTTRVPNVFPKTEVPYRLAIIGEAPGADEEAYGKPFIGASGRFLDSILSGVGILRDGCFVGNVCQHRPPGNKIEEWGYSHPKVLEGWENLQNELKEFKPNCILALGNTPLRFLCNRTGVTNWRGSILGSDYGKIIPSIHPAAVLREYKLWPLLRFDALRARAEAETKELSLPVRNLELHLTANEICYRLDNWPTGQLFSFDIEGGLDAFPCCSVAGESNRGFIIAFGRHSPDEQGRLYTSLSRCLYRVDVPKCLQNSLYDRFVLAYGYRMLIRNVVEDTMDKSWAIYPELRKGLGVIASIWTREPHYKFERKTDNPDTFYEYCIKDSCVTLEASQAMDAALSVQERKHYDFNVSLKSPLLYMELRGIKYNTQLAQQELGVCNAALSECSSRLGLRISPVQWNKKENSTDMRGKKGSLSWQRLAKILYEQKSYPTQYKGRGQNRKVTTDVEALLRLAEMPRYRNDPFLSDILLHRKLESVRETLEWTTDPDGRMRCSYNQFSKGEDTEEEGGGSTETGRLRCSTSITGSGGNLQTVTKKLRKLFIADESCFIGQDDLAGADGWTVAAHCLRHGDSTMWEDYTFGLKPARLGALFYEHPEFVSAPRDELKELSALHVDDDGWIYFAFKRIQHATNYGVKEKTVSKQIMVDSYKIAGAPVYVDTATCGVFQRIYLSRYRGLYQWHEWARGEVREGRNLTSASGHTRTFFGRRRSWDASRRQWDADHETWKEFLADEPQENTTYATNLALWKLWNDPENRMVGTDGKTHLRIEPLHQVHDAIIYQFRKEDVAWARMKMPQYHNNELEIANQKVVIPYEGKFGPSWGELGEKFGGGTI